MTVLVVLLSLVVEASVPMYLCLDAETAMYNAYSTDLLMTKLFRMMETEMHVYLHGRLPLLHVNSLL